MKKLYVRLENLVKNNYMKRKITKKKRLYKKIYGTDSRPRVSVFRSNNHIYVQAIDDFGKHTLAAASTLKLKSNKKSLNIQISQQVGKNMGEQLCSKNINSIIFDKNGRRYHGRIAGLADALREHIQF